MGDGARLRASAPASRPEAEALRGRVRMQMQAARWIHEECAKVRVRLRQQAAELKELELQTTRRIRARRTSNELSRT